MSPSQQGLPSRSLWLRTNTPFLVTLWALESNTCIWGLITLSWVVDDFYEALQGANSSCGWPDCRDSILDKSTSASPLLCRIIFKNCWSRKIYFFQKCRVILLGFLPEILFKKKNHNNPVSYSRRWSSSMYQRSFSFEFAQYLHLRTLTSHVLDRTSSRSSLLPCSIQPWLNLTASCDIF